MESAFSKHVAANHWCADCGATPAEWASKVFGVTLCLQCAGSHRGLASKTASLSLDKWTPEEEDAFVAKGGNDAVNRSVLPTTPRFALTPSTPQAVRSSYCAAKWFGKDFNLSAALTEARHSFSQSTVHTGILRVHLIHGRQLKAADISGKSDPYVVFGIGRFKEKELRSSNEAQSSIARQTLNPDWNEVFMLNVPSLNSGLTCQVWDYDPPPKKHDNLGIAFVDLSELKDGEEVEIAPSLSKKGYIRLKLNFTKL